MRNCASTLRGLAPTAMRRPISRVRSVTLTSSHAGAQPPDPHQIGLRDHSEQLAVDGDHGQARDGALLHERVRIGERGVRGHVHDRRSGVDSDRLVETTDRAP